MNGVSIKYFIITIASIFIALGIGIVIGFSMNSEKFVQKQFQQQLILIDKNLTNLKKENERLLKEIDEYQSVISQKDKINKVLFNAYLKCGKPNSNLTIIVTSSDYSYNELIDFLKENGIKIAKIIKFKSSFTNSSMQNITSNFSDNLSVDDLFKEIAIYSVFNIKTSHIDTLIEKRFIEENRFNNNISDTVIIAGGNTLQNNYFNNIDKRIINFLKDIDDLNVIGIQQSYSEANYCEFYKNMGLSSVDNIDELSGKIALIELIRGNVGNFGTKKEANSLIPSNFLTPDASEKSLKKRKESLLSQLELIRQYSNLSE